MSQLLLVDILAKSVLVLLLTAVATTLLRRASAALRHRLWFCTLVALLLVPLLSVVLRSRPALQPDVFAIPVPLPAPRILAALPTDADATVPAPALTLPPVGTTTPSALSLVSILSAIYTVGVLTVASQILIGLICVRRFAREGATVLVPAPIQTALTDAAETLNLRRPIRLLLSHVAPVPMTWGWPHPTILLPQAATDWETDRVQVALLHEAAHIARGDWMIQMFAHAVCALYWFHPLVWWATARLRMEAEQAADDRVILAGVPARDYARHLLEIAAQARHFPSAPITSTPMATSPRIEHRLRAVLTATPRRTSHQITAFVSLLFVAIFAALAAVRAERARMLPPSSSNGTTARLAPASRPTQGSFTLFSLEKATQDQIDRPSRPYFFGWFFTERDEGGVALYLRHPDLKGLSPETNHDIPQKNDRFVLTVRLSNGDTVPAGWQVGTAEGQPSLMRIILPTGYPDFVQWADITVQDRSGFRANYRLIDLPHSRRLITPSDPHNETAIRGGYTATARAWRSKYGDLLGYSYGPRPNLTGVTFDLSLRGPVPARNTHWEFGLQDKEPEWSNPSPKDVGGQATFSEQIQPDGTAHVRAGLFVPYARYQNYIRLLAEVKEFATYDERLDIPGVVIKRQKDHFILSAPKDQTVTTPSGISVTVGPDVESIAKDDPQSALDDRITVYLTVTVRGDNHSAPMALPRSPLYRRYRKPVTIHLEGAGGFDTAAVAANGPHQERIQLLLHRPKGAQTGQPITLHLAIRQRADLQTLPFALTVPVQNHP